MKKFFALLLTLALSVTLTACGGFEARLTRAAAQMRKLESFHMDMDVELDMDVDIIGKKLDMNISMLMAGDMFTDPLRAMVEMTFNAPGSRAKQLYYLVREEDGVALYLSDDEGKTWLKQNVDENKLPVQLDGRNVISQIGLFLSSAQSFTKAGSETVDGLTATRYDGVLAGSVVGEAMKLSGIFDTVSDQLGVELDTSGFEDKEIPTSIWFDNASGRLIRYEMDFTDVMMDLVAQALRTTLEAYGLDDLEGLASNVEVAGCRAVVSLSQYNAVPEFEVPEDARAA